jgi:methylated-DNA-protein-cysteine methyltransferase-like protein
VTRYQRVYAVVRRVPCGRVTTYGQVARLAGCTGPRQAGYALAALKEPTAVPWHRVVNAGGGISLTGSAAVTQRLRLQREGIRFNAQGVIDLAAFGWHGRPKTRARRPGGTDDEARQPRRAVRAGRGAARRSSRRRRPGAPV